MPDQLTSEWLTDTTIRLGEAAWTTDDEAVQAHLLKAIEHLDRIEIRKMHIEHMESA